MRRGFTLLELSAVIVILVLLTCMTVPAYDVLIRRTHAAEARSMMSAIAHAQLQHQRDHGAYLACAATGEGPAPTARFPNQEPCWQALGIQIGGQVRYRYGVTLTDGSFSVTGEGDLDGDGTLSRFTLDGRTLQVSVTDELE